MIKGYYFIILLVWLHSALLGFKAFAETDRTVSRIYIQDNHKHYIEVSSISLDYFTEIYYKIQNYERIPFRYPDDGCFARAHKTSLVLDSLNIISVKSFLVGDLKLVTNLNPQGFVQWWYHVAPAVHIKEFNELYVFDLTASDVPISKTAWMELLTQHEFGHIDETFETLRFIYSPEDAYQKNRPKDYQRHDIFNMEQSLDYFFKLLERRERSHSEINVA